MAETKTPSLDELRGAIDTALVMARTANHADEVERACYTAFIFAISAGAPRRVSYLLEAAAMRWSGAARQQVGLPGWDGPDGPRELLQLALELLDAEIEEAAAGS